MRTRGLGSDFTIGKSDGVRVDHEKKRAGIRVDHEKKSDRVRVHHNKIAIG